MLWHIRADAELLAKFSQQNVHGFTINQLTKNHWEQLSFLVDHPDAPTILILVFGADVLVLGQLPGLNSAFGDLLAGRVESASAWPPPAMLRGWEAFGSRHLFFNGSSLVAWRAARIAGFESRGHRLDEQIAYLWYWEGKVQASDSVDLPHTCRQLEGAALLEHLRLGVDYGNDCDYLRDCLRAGPSFVCEIAKGDCAKLVGRETEADRLGPLPGLRPGWVPVCWAGTHLNGTMGMIYTLPAFRRLGYGRSLAAFQINAMLARDGFACSHIVDDNQPSMQLAQVLGGRPDPEPLVWRVVYWPDVSNGSV